MVTLLGRKEPCFWSSGSVFFSLIIIIILHNVRSPSPRNTRVTFNRLPRVALYARSCHPSTPSCRFHTFSLAPKTRSHRATPSESRYSPARPSLLPPPPPANPCPPIQDQRCCLVRDFSHCAALCGKRRNRTLAMVPPHPFPPPFRLCKSRAAATIAAMAHTKHTHTKRGDYPSVRPSGSPRLPPESRSTQSP